MNVVLTVVSAIWCPASAVAFNLLTNTVTVANTPISTAICPAAGAA